ncbi:MAG: hypothetical protein HYS73_00535 [Parcubacteria group bacterium]|nr:hypothetical protein [Parcubacteria group bacterium]
MRIFTHVNPDMDALMSLVVARRYIAGVKKAEIVLRPANWDGADMDEGDVAVDMWAGGRGLKGEKGEGVIHSCFALIMAEYAPTADCLALAPIIAYVDAQDSRGNAVKYLVPEASQEARDILDATNLSARVSWLKAVHAGNVLCSVLRLEEDFEGMLIVGRSRLAAEEEARHAELFAGGAVALAVNLRTNVPSTLFNRGVRIVVFQNRHGTGMSREQGETLRMDHERCRSIVRAAGEEIGDGEGKWYAHPSGFLFARGTPKSPAKTPSRVNPRDLIRVAVALLAEVDAAKKAAECPPKEDPS